jgi:MFS family permease
LFAFILAEELTRSFLPSYIKNLLVPIDGVSPQIIISLPIVLFMLIVAIGQPYLGGWSERIGRRRTMAIGASIAAVGFAATAFAYGLWDLLVWRSLCAIGYAMVFVAAQGYVLDHSGPKDRARGFALFVGAIMVATVCGPATGGILADNIGARYTFLIAALICILSVLTIKQLPGDAQKRGANLRDTKVPNLREIGSLCLNRRFMVLTGLAAIPAKIVLTGFCFYLVPLYILSLGSTQAMAGRMLLVYAVIMVILVPIAAGFSDAGAKRERFVALGLIVSGLGGLALLATGNVLLVFVVVIFLGLGPAVSIASQGALVEDLCGPEIAKYGRDTVYGVYRLLERMGNAVGPLLASVLVIYFNYQGAFVAISALVLFCGVLFALATLSGGQTKAVEA